MLSCKQEDEYCRQNHKCNNGGSLISRFGLIQDFGLDSATSRLMRAPVKANYLALESVCSPSKPLALILLRTAKVTIVIDVKTRMAIRTALAVNVRWGVDVGDVVG